MTASPNGASTAAEIIRAGAPALCRPWPRFDLSPDAWRAMAAALAAEPGLAFLALWADTQQVHALFHAGAPLIASAPVEAGLYAALSPARPGAALFERAVSDLWGHQAADATETRPWLDHGAWTMLRPLSDRPVPNAGVPEVPEMAAADGEALGFGPLPPGWATPSHWRMAVVGTQVVQAEARFGYAHRGVLGLMRGKSPQGAARLVARIDGTATCAHAAAFARAVEAALELPPPPRAAALRTAMVLIERVAVGLHDLHATATALGLGGAPLQRSRERLLEACDAAFGHRLMMDRIIPGGVHGDLTPEGAAILDAALEAVEAPALRWPPGLGVLSTADAWRLSPGGIGSRASSVPDPLAPGAAMAEGGDVAARMAMRAEALLRDALRAREALSAAPEGIAWIAPGHASAEGVGVADGPAGRVWHWVRLAGGVVAACFAGDPAWLTLPAVECAMQGGSLADAPAVTASFGLRAPGMDL